MVHTPDRKNHRAIKQPNNRHYSMLLFWLSAIGLGCLTLLLADPLSLSWSEIKPLPSAIAGPFLNTPLEPVGMWLPLLFLSAPEAMMLFALGLLAGLLVRPRCWRWLAICMGTYILLAIASDGHVWQRTINAIVWGIHPDIVKYGSISIAICTAGCSGTFLITCFVKCKKEPGVCEKCGYFLYGLESSVCPECGTEFSIRDDRLFRKDVPANQDIERETSLYPTLLHGRRVAWIRICVLGLSLSLFYGLDWIPLRTLLRNVIFAFLEMSGYAPVSTLYEGAPAIRVYGEVHYFTAECTYLDLLMIVLPFVWVFSKFSWANIVRVGTTAAAILGGNLIRCWAAIYFSARGVSWFYAHDIPDYLIWWPTAVIIPLRTLRNDVRNSSECSCKNTRK